MIMVLGRISATKTIPNIYYDLSYERERLNNSEMIFTFTIETRLANAENFLSTGNDLNCTIIVNGVKGTVELKNKGESWSGNSAQPEKTIEIICPSTSGGSYRVEFEVTNSYGVAGEVTDNSLSVSSLISTYTSCTAPTYFQASVFNPLNSSKMNYAAPGGLITLSWSEAKGGTDNPIKGYQIQYKDNKDNIWKNINSDGYHFTSETRGELNFTLPEDKEGVKYSFRIKTIGVIKNYDSSYYGVTDACTTYSKPIVYTSVNSGSLSGSYSFTIGAYDETVNTNNNISYYKIFYSESHTGINKSDQKELIADNVKSLPYTWNGGIEGHNYYFLCVAVGENYSESSDEDKYWTQTPLKKIAQYTRCSPPSQIQLTPNYIDLKFFQGITYDRVTFSWQHGGSGTNNTYTGSEYSYSLDGGLTYSTNILTTGMPVAEIQSITIPQNAIEFILRVRTTGAAGIDYYSDWVEYKMPVIKDPLYYNSASVKVDTEITNNIDRTIKISWQNFASNSSNPIQNYKIYYSRSKDGMTFGDITSINLDIPASSTSYEFTNYTPFLWNYYYKFFIQAIAKYSESPLIVSKNIIYNELPSGKGNALSPRYYNYKNSAYIKINDQHFAIANQNIQMKAEGIANIIYEEVYCQFLVQTASTIEVISEKLVAVNYDGRSFTAPIIVDSYNEKTDQYDINAIRFALKRKLSNGSYSVAYSDILKITYKIQSDKEFPTLKIKRKKSHVNPEVEDGEFIYDVDDRILKIGNLPDSNNKFFTRQPSLFGRLEIGDNNISGNNTLVVGIGNEVNNKIFGYAILNAIIGTPQTHPYFRITVDFTLSSIQDLQTYMYCYVSSNGNVYYGMITKINLNNTITMEFTYPNTDWYQNMFININDFKQTGEFSIYHNGFWLNNGVLPYYNSIDLTRKTAGFISGINNNLYTPSGYLIGNNLETNSKPNNNGAVIVGRYNKIDEGSSSDSLVFAIGNGTPTERKNVLEIRNATTLLNSNLSSNASNTYSIGSENSTYKNIYTTEGVSQTSNRDEKYDINYIENASPKLKTKSLLSTPSIIEEKITSDDIITFIKNIKPATFIYKNNENTQKTVSELVGTNEMSSIQLGLIADDIVEEKLYKYIGIDIPKEENSEIQHKYGLQPLPVATLALTGCKILLERIEELEQKITYLESLNS